MLIEIMSNELQQQERINLKLCIESLISCLFWHYQSQKGLNKNPLQLALSGKLVQNASLKVSFSEMCPYVYPKNVTRNCSSPSEMVCKGVVEFPLDVAGTILHGVFIKRDQYNRKLFLSTEEINLFQGQSTFSFYKLVPSRQQGRFSSQFLAHFSLSYTFPYCTLDMNPLM